MVFWTFFIVLTLLLSVVAFLKLSFVILVSFDGDGFHLNVKVMLYKILTLYEWTLKEGGVSFLLKKKKDVPENLKKKKGRLSGIIDTIFSKDTYRHLKKDMETFDISVKGRVASSDAARTAMLYGGIWSIIGSLIPFIPQKRLILDFYPDFNKEVPDFHISCILRVRITHIIVLIVEHKHKNIKKDRGENYGTASY